MEAIPVIFFRLSVILFSYKYDNGDHLEFRNIVKMPGLIQRYMKDKYLKKGPKKKNIEKQS